MTMARLDSVKKQPEIVQELRQHSQKLGKKMEKVQQECITKSISKSTDRVQSEHKNAVQDNVLLKGSANNSSTLKNGLDSVKRQSEVAQEVNMQSQKNDERKRKVREECMTNSVSKCNTDVTPKSGSPANCMIENSIHFNSPTSIMTRTEDGSCDSSSSKKRKTVRFDVHTKNASPVSNAKTEDEDVIHLGDDVSQRSTQSNEPTYPTPISKGFRTFFHKFPPPRRLDYMKAKSLENPSSAIQLSTTDAITSSGCDGLIPFWDTLGSCHLSESSEFGWGRLAANRQDNSTSSEVDSLLSYDKGLGRVYYSTFHLRGTEYHVGDYIAGRERGEVCRIIGAYQATKSFFGVWNMSTVINGRDKLVPEEEIQKRGKSNDRVLTTSCSFLKS
jgi:hypothetical protein